MCVKCLSNATKATTKPEAPDFSKTLPQISPRLNFTPVANDTTANAAAGRYGSTVHEPGHGS